MINLISNLGYFANRQNIPLGYSFKIDSNNPGPKIAITVAIHGNENVGIDAVMALDNQLNGIKFGSVVVIVGNPMAYLLQTRFLHSNLNRCFSIDTIDSVDNTVNNYESCRALEITNFLREYNPDFLLDLHSVSIGDVQMEIQDSNSIVSNGLKDKSVMQIIVRDKVIDGGLIQLPFLKSSLAVECGNHVSTKGLEIAKNKIMHTLFYYKMIDDSLFDQQASRSAVNSSIVKTNYTYSLIAPIIPRSGFKFVRDDVDSEMFIKQGEVYAVYEGGEMIAPIDCYLWVPCTNPKLTDTDAGFLAIRVD